MARRTTGTERVQRAVRRPPYQQLPLPGAEYAPACVFSPEIGRNHMRYRPSHPYNFCVTRNQFNHLWGIRAEPVKPVKLGCGVFACVWAKDKNKVVKITNDQSDVEALKKANRHSIRGVPKLYRAFRLKGRTTSQHPVFGMVVERVRGSNELPTGATEPIYCIKDTLAYTGPDPAAIKEECCEVFQSGDERHRYCNTMAEQMPDVMEDLDAIGVPLGDLHEHNIGLGRGGQWKVIDLGLSGESWNATKGREKRPAGTLQGARGRKRFRRVKR